MKTKFFLLLMTIGMLLAVPVVSYGQYTDEDLDYEGGNSGNGEWGPVSLEPELIKGIISYNNQTITNTFLFDLGVVTIWIVDEKGNLYISEEVNTTEEKSIVIDIKALPAQKYKMICFTKEGQQTARFEVKK